MSKARSAVLVAVDADGTETVVWIEVLGSLARFSALVTRTRRGLEARGLMVARAAPRVRRRGAVSSPGSAAQPATDVTTATPI